MGSLQVRASVPHIEGFTQASSLWLHRNDLEKAIVEVQAYHPTLRIHDTDLPYVRRPASPILQISVGERDQFAVFVAQDAKSVSFCGEEQQILALGLRKEKVEEVAGYTYAPPSIDNGYAP